MSTSKPTNPQDSGNHSPTHAEIAELAFQLHEKRGGLHGHDREDWLEAERMLRHPGADGPKPSEAQGRDAKIPFTEHPHPRDKQQSHGRREIRRMNTNHRPPARDSHQVF